ncbi:MAG: flagellar biosynthesis protein FlhF, partial [Planctomycetota bacterium]
RERILGVGREGRVEITAAACAEDLPEPLRRGTLSLPSRRTVGAEGAARRMPVPGTAAVNDVPSSQRDALATRVATLCHAVEDLVRETRRRQIPEWSDRLYETYQRLVRNEVAEELAHRLVDEVRRELSASQLQDAEAVRAALAKKIEGMLPVAGGIRPRHRGRPTIIALIGPTGVGKTTTIAKLAANMCLREGRKVGLITIDTYRIAAVEQLRTYADLIDVPLHVVMSPPEMKDAVAKLADREVILVDTAGRSQRDGAKIRELRSFFDMVRPDEIHLVLSGTSGEAVLDQTIREFREVGVDRVLFTKLDEAIGFGVMLACLQKAQAELSYVTTGQDVPEDIHVGEPRALVKLILGEGEPAWTPSGEEASAAGG